MKNTLKNFTTGVVIVVLIFASATIISSYTYNKATEPVAKEVQINKTEYRTVKMIFASEIKVETVKEYDVHDGMVEVTTINGQEYMIGINNIFFINE